MTDAVVTWWPGSLSRCWVTCLGTSLQMKLVVSLPEKCVDVVTLCILTHSLKLTQGAIYYHSSLLWPLSLFPGHSLSPIFGRLQCKIVFAYCKQSKFGVREDLGTRLLVTWRSSYKPSKYIVVMYFWFDYVPHGTPVGLKSLFQAFHSGFVQSCKRNFRIESQGSRLLKSNQAQLQNNPAK